MACRGIHLINPATGEVLGAGRAGDAWVLRAVEPLPSERLGTHSFVQQFQPCRFCEDVQFDERQYGCNRSRAPSEIMGTARSEARRGALGG